MLEDLREADIRRKRHVLKDGSVRGGIPFTRGPLFHLLGKPIDRGDMVHKGKAVSGEHEAIIEEDLWQRVQQRIAGNTVDRKSRHNAGEASLLAGIIFDGHGRKMCPSHTVRKAKRYRYYATHPDKVVDDTPPWRLPAFDIEKRVIGVLTDYLDNPQALRKLVLTDGVTAERDDMLVALLREAMTTRDELLAEPTRGICQLASATVRCSKRMTRLLRLSWLAPEIVEAILAGRQPAHLTPRALLSTELPLDWAAQKAALGF